MRITLGLSLLFLAFSPMASELKMRALRMHAYGGPEVLHIEQAPVPTPAAGEVRIRIHAAGINPADSGIRAGRMQGMYPMTFPYIPGHEIAGKVDAVGPGVTQWKVGDSVIASVMGGGLAEYAIALPANIAPKPSKLSYEEAAGIPATSVTAWRTLIESTDIKPGQRVLIHGGAGGVGSIAVQLAHWRGAYVIATASERNHGYLKSLGADETIDYRTTKFEDVVKNADVVLVTVRGDTLERSYAVLRKGGTLLSITGSPSAQACAEHELVCPDWDAKSPEFAGEQLAKLSELFDSGVLKINVDAVFPLEDANKALQLNAEGHTRGKIVVRVVD